MNTKGNRWKRGIGRRVRRSSYRFNVAQMVEKTLTAPKPISYGKLTAQMDFPDWGICEAAAKAQKAWQAEEKEKAKALAKAWAKIVAAGQAGASTEGAPLAKPRPKVIYNMAWRSQAPTEEQLRQEAAEQREEEIREAFRKLRRRGSK